MSPLPRRMLGSAASWENPQVHPLPLPEVLTYVVLAVAIRLFGGFPHQILNSRENHAVQTTEFPAQPHGCEGRGTPQFRSAE